MPASMGVANTDVRDVCCAIIADCGRGCDRGTIGDGIDSAAGNVGSCCDGPVSPGPAGAS